MEGENADIGWKYYNHAVIPTCGPHEKTDVSRVYDGSVWRIDRRALFARWSDDFDCRKETDWWYVIKDTPFDISQMKSKRRYEINKGVRNFKIELIDPSEHIEELVKVQIGAYEGYSEELRPEMDEGSFRNKARSWDGRCYAAFHEQGGMVGYAYLIEHDEWCDFSILRTLPDYERLGVNAAIIYKMLMDYEDRLGNGFYICDGARTISHETHFQAYLEKYFGFRKAYCRLRLAYRKWPGAAVRMLYPFRKHIYGKSMITKNIKSVLNMEEIRRNCE